jgi:hypothetical protein
MNLDETLSLLFIPFKQAFVRDGEKYDQRVEANKRNGLKGGRPKTQLNPTKAKKPSGLNQNPENLDSDNDSDIKLAAVLKKLASLLGERFNVENGKAFRKTKSGWSVIENPTAYLEAIEKNNPSIQEPEYIDARDFHYKTAEEYIS